jgi:hypothetical protein
MALTAQQPSLLFLKPYGPRPPEQPTLVALPGLGRNALSYPPCVFQPVLQTGVRVAIANYGSDIGSMDDMARHVWRALDDAALAGPFVLLGYSMGGFVAQTMYAQEPGRVYGVALCATAAPTRGDLLELLFTPKGNAHMRRVMREDGASEEAEALRRFAAVACDQTDYMRTYLHSRLPASDVRKQAFAIAAFSWSNRSLDIVRSMQCPLLVLSGECDDIVLPSTTERMVLAATAAASVAVHTWPQGDHYLLLEHPRVFGQTLAHWLLSIDFAPKRDIAF